MAKVTANALDRTGYRINFQNQIEMSVSEILNIGSADAGVTSVSTSMAVWGSI